MKSALRGTSLSPCPVGETPREAAGCYRSIDHILLHLEGFVNTHRCRLSGRASAGARVLAGHQLLHRRGGGRLLRGRGQDIHVVEGPQHPAHRDRYGCAITALYCAARWCAPLFLCFFVSLVLLRRVRAHIAHALLCSYDRTAPRTVPRTPGDARTSVRLYARTFARSYARRTFARSYHSRVRTRSQDVAVDIRIDTPAAKDKAGEKKEELTEEEKKIKKEKDEKANAKAK